MTPLDILRLRLANQQISAHAFTTPGELVGWLGAVQAQDYVSAKWALGLRLPRSTYAGIERALDEGAILRTHVLRPTWHFVAPADIRWMLALTAARVKAQMAYYSRRAGLESEVFKRSQAIIASELAGGKQFTRAELAAALEKRGFTLKSNQLLHILAHAELDAVICSGAKRGKQLTWALLDDRVPPTKALTREEAVAELTRRYFRSHGPATTRDFAWWSGLSTAEIKSGLALLKPQVISEIVEGQTYWYSTPALTSNKASPKAYLLPPFDEYMVGYTDRRLLKGTEEPGKQANAAVSLLSPTIIVGGKIVGTWRRPTQNNAVVLEVNLYSSFTAAQLNNVKMQAARYGDFLGLPVELALR